MAQTTQVTREVEAGGVYAVEPFNTTGKSGMVENVPPQGSSNILRVTGNVKIRKALKKGKLKPLVHNGEIYRGKVQYSSIC